jgi:hypothetical protein
VRLDACSLRDSPHRLRRIAENRAGWWLRLGFVMA